MRYTLLLRASRLCDGARTIADIRRAFEVTADALYRMGEAGVKQDRASGVDHALLVTRDPEVARQFDFEPKPELDDPAGGVVPLVAPPHLARLHGWQPEPDVGLEEEPARQLESEGASLYARFWQNENVGYLAFSIQEMAQAYWDAAEELSELEAAGVQVDAAGLQRGVAVLTTRDPEVAQRFDFMPADSPECEWWYAYLRGTRHPERHNQVLIQCGPQRDFVDEGLAPLLAEIWKAGIRTWMSCQESASGVAAILFATSFDAREFLNAVAVCGTATEGSCEADTPYEDTLYSRMVPELICEDMWEYRAHPDNRGFSADYDEEQDRWFTFRSGPNDIDFEVSVRLPTADLPEVLELMRRANTGKPVGWASRGVVRGPIPLDWLGRACALPGRKTLATALAIWSERARRQTTTFGLPAAALRRFQVSRRGRDAALAALEQAGLIRVFRRKRRSPLVTVLGANAAGHAAAYPPPPAAASLTEAA